MFGLPSYVHTEQGSNFMFYKFKSWLHSMGVPTSRTTRYNPKSNEQVKSYNSIIWKTIVLALHVKRLLLTLWKYVLPNVLYSTGSAIFMAMHILSRFSRKNNKIESLLH